VTPAFACLDDAIKSNAASNPSGWAIMEPGGRVSWAAYDAQISLLAAHLLDQGLQPGDRVGIHLRDGVAVHVALSACLRAGLVAVAVGARSGLRELRHLLGKSQASALLTEAEHRGFDRVAGYREIQPELPALKRLLLIEEILAPIVGEVVEVADRVAIATAEARLEGRHGDPRALSLINSTSGTTGLPKCVAHNERRWIKYHDYAVDAGELTSGDTFMSVVPAPFGFGLWTAHFTPTLLGAPVVVLPGFDAGQALTMLATERVSVLMAVSTQFIMMLDERAMETVDLSRLRVLFTGGEAIPRHKALEFERRTGAVLLNMYGSNETGVQSYTTLRDTKERRFASAGKVIDEVAVRLFDAAGQEIRRGAEAGRPASHGEVCSLGYYDDGAANAQLFTPDGWMLMGDLVTIDDEGYLRVVGRTSDFIIRGGKNISAVAVEEEVGTHPGVLRCAVVAMPDPVFGERVCVYVVARPGTVLELAGVVAHLQKRGVSREWFPERLVVLDVLPTSDGGKVAKAALRADLEQRMRQGGPATT
jgi:acyl-CoA synthetase